MYNDLSLHTNTSTVEYLNMPPLDNVCNCRRTRPSAVHALIVPDFFTFRDTDFMTNTRKRPHSPFLRRWSTECTIRGITGRRAKATRRYRLCPSWQTREEAVKPEGSRGER